MSFKDPEKMKDYQRKWIAKRRSDFFSNKQCVQCGSIENLELDHIDPTTKVSSAIWSWAKKRREAEIAKCQVLCEKHHMIKTISQMPVAYKHGTGTEYRRGCKCPPCRSWKSAENKRNRKR